VTEEKKTTHWLYIQSVEKFRSGFPRFIMFLSAVFLLWVFSPLILSLGKDVFIRGIEVTRIINLLLLSYTLIFILLTFREIREVADAVAGYIVYSLSPVDEEENKLRQRYRKIRSNFRQLSYILVTAVLYSIFKQFLLSIVPEIVAVFGIVIVLWLLLTLYAFSLSIAAELEERTNRILRKINGKNKRRKSSK